MPRKDDESGFRIMRAIFGRRKEEQPLPPIKTVPPVYTHELLSRRFPEQLRKGKPFANPQVQLFEVDYGEIKEYNAVFMRPLSPADWWELLYGLAPYKQETPYAVTTDWKMYSEEAYRHMPAFGDAWTDFVSRVKLFEELLTAFREHGTTRNPRTSQPFSNNYLLPVSRWRLDQEGNRSHIFNHSENKRHREVEATLKKIADQKGVNYDPDRADEFAGFLMNTYLAYHERRQWKPFMNFAGKESKVWERGMQFVGPAQVGVRAHMAQAYILKSPFYRNSEAKFKEPRTS